MGWFGGDSERWEDAASDVDGRERWRRWEWSGVVLMWKTSIVKCLPTLNCKKWEMEVNLGSWTEPIGQWGRGQLGRGIEAEKRVYRGVRKLGTPQVQPTRGTV